MKSVSGKGALWLIGLGICLVLTGLWEGFPQKKSYPPELSTDWISLFPKQVSVTVQTADKRVIGLTAFVAETRTQQARGLMFVPTLPENQGMIFPNAIPRTVAFWMKNTLIPLDLIFYQSDGRIVQIYSMAQPLSEDLIFSTGVVAGVMEVNGGWCTRHRVQVGDLIQGLPSIKKVS